MSKALQKIKFVDVILTAEEGQQNYKIPFHIDMMESKEKFISCLLMSTIFKNKTIKKISTCIYFNDLSSDELPKWYDDCNGKFWFNQDDSKDNDINF